MAWDWMNKIVHKIASEAHKSKIEDFEKRIAEMEKNQKLILKSLKDNEESLKKMDDRIYQANMESSKAVGAIQTVIQSGIMSNSIKNGQNGK